MNQLEKLAYDQRKQVGKTIRILPDGRIWRTEKETTVKEVALCPWSNSARMLYLTALEIGEYLPYRARLHHALKTVKNYYNDNPDQMDLRVTYFTEAKSDKETSQHLHMMLDAEDFEFLN